MDVKITVIGVQEMDGQTDKTEMTTVGTLSEDANGFVLQYAESAATGLNDTVTTLRIQPQMVTMERTGAHTGLLVLEHKKRHLCSYATPIGNVMLGVYTEAVDTQLTRMGGTVKVSYTLDVGGNMMSRQHLTVCVDRKEKCYV